MHEAFVRLTTDQFPANIEPVVIRLTKKSYP